MRHAGTILGLLMATAGACDDGSAARVARLEEQLAERDARISELRAELDRVQAELQARRADETRVAAPAASAAPEVTPPPTVDAASKIRCAADRCTIGRADFDALTADGDALARQARIVPNLEDDVTRGFKLFGVRATSPFAAVGLKNGDIVLELAGRPLRGADDVMAAYAALRTASEWTIAGERQGAPFVVTIVVTG